jgi:hypothetical protein
VNHTSASSPSTWRGRRRPARRPDPFGLPSTDGTAAAAEDVAEAQTLFDDLVALLDLGLVVAIEDSGTVRYEATNETYQDDRRPSR